MAIINIKFTKFDNTPWGFRLAGGSDFPHPLTVIRVTEGSLAECMGLKEGDIVVRLNDEPISSLTHGQAHQALMMAGNNFVLAVQREEEALNALQALSDENIVPYKIPLADLPPVFPEQILQEETITQRYEEEIIEHVPAPEQEVEKLPDKPKDANSETVPNENLTDEEIAQLILIEEELIVPEQGVLGVNFKKPRPLVPTLRGSKVLEELQHVASAPPPEVEERKHISTFLKKPERPIPTPRKQKEEEQDNVEPYKVVIKKQSKKSVTARLLEKGLLTPDSLIQQEQPPETATTKSETPEPPLTLDQEKGVADSRPESKAETCEREATESREEITEVSTSDEKEKQQDQIETSPEESTQEEKSRREAPEEGEEIKEVEISKAEEPILAGIEKQMADLVAKVDKKKIKELVSTEISLEKQLENVQRQLIALKQLPSEIENHLRIVSDQLQKIMELSGMQNGSGPNSRRGSSEQETRLTEETSPRTEVQEEVEERKDEEEIESLQSEGRPSTAMSQEIPHIVEPSEEEFLEEEESETRELEGTISIKSNEDDGSRVKKFVVSYETKVIRSRGPSPALSQGSFEPDPNLSAKDQVIQELQHRTKQRKQSKDLWPQAKQLELTLGRRWRCPNDFFNDDMIAEILSSQAEVIRGRALGVNFKKYEKTNLPNYDHLMNSSVYKMIHKMEREPKKGIPARPPKVNAAEDIIERVKSPAFRHADDSSTRSVSH